MRIVHVLPSIEQEASGPSYSVASLSRTMTSAGMASTLIATGPPRVVPGLDLLNFPRRRFPYRLGRSPEMYRWLEERVATKHIDIVHNHSIWMMPNVYPGWATRNTNVPLVVSPRGTFSEWAMRHSQFVKLLFWNGLQKRAIKHAGLFHATAESEYRDIRRLGFRQPVAIIPNGVAISPMLAQDKIDSHHTLLFLSRIHPKKGLEILLTAWARLQARYPNWRLRIVGPGDRQYLRQLGELATSLMVERVRFEGPIYGIEKQRAYQSAGLFVLPTHSENFGMAIAEALAAGCPVITTKGAPWSSIPEEGVGWWIDLGVEPLQLALEQAMSNSPRTLAQMGAKGQRWMEKDFSWEQAANKMLESYRWLQSGGATPSWIQHD